MLDYASFLQKKGVSKITKDKSIQNQLQEMTHGKSDEFPSPFIKNWEDRLNQLEMLVTYFFTERKIGTRMVPGESV